MKEGTPSITAEGALIFRAVEARKPAGLRICNDDVAPKFLAPDATAIGRSWIPEPIARYIYNCLMPGLQGYIVARTKYLDDYLEEHLQQDFQQIVVLGAGYDSRAYRYAELAAGVKFFEVDHPASQQAKRAKLTEIFGDLPSHVTYVPIDFVKDSLEEQLLENGFDPAQKTIFLWEGVTYYITAEAVDQTLAFIARKSAAGSSVIFDYTYPSVVEGTCNRREAKVWRRTMIPRGEDVLFGIEENTIEAFMQQRGFENIKDVTDTDLKQQYFTGRNSRRFISPIFSIVSATTAR